jgi:hypothetical protein
LVFDGTVGSANSKYLGVIKAEKQSGFGNPRSLDEMIPILTKPTLSGPERLKGSNHRLTTETP